MKKIFGILGKAEPLPARFMANSWQQGELLITQFDAPPLLWRERYVLCHAGELFEPLADNIPLLLQEPSLGLEKIEGNFALALWDIEAQTLLLARDPMGTRPMYYAQWGKKLVFASKLADIAGLPGFDKQLDLEALTSFIKFNFIPGHSTIYHHIKKLPMGGMLLKKPDQEPIISSYFDPVSVSLNAPSFTASDEQLINNLQSMLRAAVKRQLHAHENSVLLLSGGVDSSLLAAMLQEQGLKQAITVAFDHQGFDESHYAAQVARHLGIDHTIKLIGHKDIIDIVRGMYDIYEEPYADASQIPTTYALKIAKQQMGAHTAFVGDGGDEFFMGLSDHDKYMQWGIPADPHSGRYNLKQIAKFPKRYFMHLLFSKDIDYYNKWKANRLYKKTLLRPHEPHTVYREMARVNTVANHLRRALMFETMVGIPGIVTIKCNRPAEAYGLNLRSPLLNSQTFTFAQHLPEHMLFQQGKRKYILLKLLEKYMPAKFFERRKAGFSVPLSDWLKGPLRPWAEEMIDERKLRAQGYFNAKFIRKIWESNSRHIEKLWGLFMFQAWLEKNQP